MPRYFFNTYHDVATIDRDGIELNDKDAAWEETTQAAGEITEV